MNTGLNGKDFAQAFAAKINCNKLSAEQKKILAGKTGYQKLTTDLTAEDVNKYTNVHVSTQTGIFDRLSGKEPERLSDTELLEFMGRLRVNDQNMYEFFGIKEADMNDPAQVSMKASIFRGMVGKAFETIF